MRRRHMPRPVIPHTMKAQQQTVCGWNLSAHEYAATQNRKWRHVNCKRCLDMRDKGGED